MAHFAQLDQDNIVTQVIVISNTELLDENQIEQEDLGVAFCKQLCGEETNWKQTSYNNNFRRCYAGIGYSYNSELDIFIEPKPYPSWSFSTNALNWEPPVQKPDGASLEENQFYVWSEEDLNWKIYEPPST